MAWSSVHWVNNHVFIVGFLPVFQVPSAKIEVSQNMECICFSQSPAFQKRRHCNQDAERLFCFGKFSATLGGTIDYTGKQAIDIWHGIYFIECRFLSWFQIWKLFVSVISVFLRYRQKLIFMEHNSSIFYPHVFLYFFHATPHNIFVVCEKCIFKVIF